MNLPINYPPEFRVRDKFKHLENLFNSSENIKLKEEIEESYRSVNNLFFDGNNFKPQWENNWFMVGHVMSLMGVLNKYRPKTILEIGSGWSTKFAIQTIKEIGLETEYKIIDPQPRAEVSSIVDTHIKQRLEDVDNDGILNGVDLLFFDGSHRCLQNSDVTVFFMEIIPQLKPGTVVGVHDIFLPDDYPQKWIPRYYNEQYMLGAYLLGCGDRVRIASFPGILWFELR